MKNYAQRKKNKSKIMANTIKEAFLAKVTANKREMERRAAVIIQSLTKNI